MGVSVVLEGGSGGWVTWGLFGRVGFASGEGGMPGETAEAGGTHGNYDAEVTAAVCVEEEEDGGLAAGVDAVP